MDNASIHKALTLKPFLNKFRILYNAPYSPFINPIEEFFGNWKFYFRKRFAQNTIEIIQKIHQALLDIELSNLAWFHIHCLQYLLGCLKMKPIL